MTLTAGTRLGPYEVIEPIGKGGMGEVYRARDSKLDRDVAIKVLPDELAADEERSGVVEREAVRVGPRSTIRCLVTDFDGTTSPFNLGTPRAILDEIPFSFADNAFRRSYDPAPDGESFVMTLLGEEGGGTGELHVVLHWTTELGERIPVK